MPSIHGESPGSSAAIELALSRYVSMDSGHICTCCVLALHMVGEQGVAGTLLLAALLRRDTSHLRAREPSSQLNRKRAAAGLHLHCCRRRRTQTALAIRRGSLLLVRRRGPLSQGFFCVFLEGGVVIVGTLAYCGAALAGCGLMAAPFEEACHRIGPECGLSA
jgi:hypothetical protein